MPPALGLLLAALVAWPPLAVEASDERVRAGLATVFSANEHSGIVGDDSAVDRAVRNLHAALFER